MKRFIETDVFNIGLLNLPSEILLTVVCQIKYTYPWQLIHFLELKLRTVCKNLDEVIKLNIKTICCLLKTTPIHYCACMNLQDKIMEFNIEDKYSLRGPDSLGYSPGCYATACGAYNAMIRLKVANALDTKYTSFQKLKNLVSNNKSHIVELLQPQSKLIQRYSGDWIVNVIYRMEFNIITSLKKGNEFFESNPDFKMFISLYETLNVNESIYYKFMDYVYKNWLIHSCWDILYNDKNVELWNDCLKYNINLNNCDENGTTFLHLASRNEILDYHLSFLLKQKDIETSKEDIHGFSPLDIASYCENLKALKILLDHNLNPYTNSTGKISAILLCVRYNKYKSLENIVNHNKEKILEYINSKDDKLLYEAISYKSIECLKFIINKIYINKINTSSLFINHSLVNNNTEALQLLIENGVKAHNEWFPLKTIINKKSYNCFTILIKNYNKLGYLGCINDLLIMCSMLGEIDFVKILLENGVDVNFKNKQNLTPLLGAVSNNKINCVKILLEHGADVNLSGTITLEDININDYKQKIIYSKCTPLHLSCYYNNKEIMELLKLTYKADNLLKVTCNTYIKGNSNSDIFNYSVELLPDEILQSRFPIKRSYIF